MAESKKNEKSRRRTREEWARTRGYDGPWPAQSTPPPKTADEFAMVLAKVADGEWKASSLHQLGRTALTFAAYLQPTDFEDFASILLEILADPQTANTSRLRAAQAALNQIPGILRLLMEMRQHDHMAPIQHVEICLSAFVARIGEDGIKRAIEGLKRMTGLRGKDARKAIRAIEALMKLSYEMARVLALLDEGPGRVRAVDESDPRLQEADAELAEMEAEIMAEAKEVA